MLVSRHKKNVGILSNEPIPAGSPPDPNNSSDKTLSESEKTKQAGEKTELITELGQTQLPVSKSNVHVITIVGQVEGHLVLPPQNKTTKYEHIIPQLVAVEQNPEIEGLLIILNTVGGDVEAGLAIAEMIASLTKPTVSIVLGGGHSIGVPIAVSANYSFIAHTATMTIHPIRLTGLVIGVQQSFDYLDKMQDRVINFITANSKISENKIRELMMTTGELARDIGTITVGSDAVQYGLIDEVGGVGEAIKKLNELIAKKRNDQAGGVH